MLVLARGSNHILEDMLVAFPMKFLSQIHESQSIQNQSFGCCSQIHQRNTSFEYPDQHYNMNFNIDQPNLIFDLGEALATHRQVSLPSSIPQAVANTQMTTTKGLTALPLDFSPTNYTVVLGRGKGAYNYCGNRRCRVIVKSFLRDFYKLETRSERSVIVSKVISIIKEACPVGSFVKMENGVWYQVPDKIAREKIFTMFRDVDKAESRESRRASSSSPEKLSTAAFAATTQTMPRTAKTVSLPPTQPDSLRGIFHPIMQNDDDSLAESLGSSKGFYDIDSCSLCTI